MNHRLLFFFRYLTLGEEEPEEQQEFDRRFGG